MSEMIAAVCGFSVPEFNVGSIEYVSTIGNCVALSAYDTEFDDFQKYSAELKAEGFSCIDEHKLWKNSFGIYKRGDNTVFISYYPDCSHMTAVYEDKAYIRCINKKETHKICDTTITQLKLKGFGMSYIIALSDGRFVIIDGGCMYEEDADSLMNVLSELSPFSRPVIAAWIMTHPHIDHYRCFMIFDKKYHDDVVYESFIYSFPEISEKELEINPIYKIQNEDDFLPIYEQQVRDTGAEIIRPHTGEIFEFADARFEVLSAPEDCYKTPLENINAISLVIKMTACGQVTLWTADCDFSSAYLVERWGEYLKADILQTAHHGFIMGGTIEGYKLIDPSVCLHPDNFDCFNKVGILYDTNKTLYKSLNVKALFVGGDGDVTLKLPFYPPSNGQRSVIERFENGYNSNGKLSWIFPSVARDSDEFVIVNTVNLPSEIYANVYFDHFSKRVERVRLEAPPLSRYVFKLSDEIKKISDKLPEDKLFAVQFTSYYPVHISNE